MNKLKQVGGENMKAGRDYCVHYPTDIHWKTKLFSRKICQENRNVLKVIALVPKKSIHKQYPERGKNL